MVERGKKEKKWREVVDWSEKAGRRFEKETEKFEIEEVNTEEFWEKMLEKIRERVRMKMVKGK